VRLEEAIGGVGRGGVVRLGALFWITISRARRERRLLHRSIYFGNWCPEFEVRDLAVTFSGVVTVHAVEIVEDKYVVRAFYFEAISFRELS
jgi:hypothetical protein